MSNVTEFKKLLQELNDYDIETSTEIPYQLLVNFIYETGNEYRFIDDLSDDDIIEMYESLDTDFTHAKIKSLVEEIYELKRNGKDYADILDELIYNVIGRIN